MPSSAVRVDDPRVSEAHALVSLRGRSLKLIGLRGGFEVDGERCTEVVLTSGQQISLADDVHLAVLQVDLPSRVLALVLPDGQPRELTGAVYSLVASPTLALVGGFVPGASAWLWSAADGWYLRRGTEDLVAMAPLGAWDVDGQTVRAISLPLAVVATETTIGHRIEPPLRLVARHDTVHIHRTGHPVVALTGQPARILSELALMDAPVPWSVVAGDIWRNETDMAVLRQNWDQALRRLRRKLGEASIRQNLVHSDGAGNIEILFAQGDQVEDQT